MPVLQTPQKFHLAKTSITTIGAILTAFAENVGEERKIGVMFIILVISFFAVSFPSISQQVSFLRIPGILFFIGKHFGTGVILATAFIHLLDDAFRSLQDQKVEEKYRGIGKWTGSIILASLLSIFLVEYVSTSYVERLHEKPSAPPTPMASRPSSRLGSPTSNQPSPSRSKLPRKVSSSRSRSRSISKPYTFPPRPTAEPPLIPDLDSPPNISFTRAPSAPVLPIQAHAHLNIQQHHLHSAHHHHHHPHGPTIPASAVVGLPIEVLTNSPRICRLALAHDHVHGHHHHIWESDVDGITHYVEGEALEEVERIEHPEALEHEHEHEALHRIGRRRQVVGLLVSCLRWRADMLLWAKVLIGFQVLQLGIMIHSLVIGLTLSVTSGSDFTSLTTAVIFHQLFEGLSLGIRIAALPPKRKKSHTAELAPKDDDMVNGMDSLSPQTRTAFPERRIHDIEGSSPGSPSTQQSTLPLPLGDNHSVHANGNGTWKDHIRFPLHLTTPTISVFSKTAPRITGALSACCRRWVWKIKESEWLKPTLTFLFGVTTPFGMGLGIAIWNRRVGVDPGGEGSMLLIQGVMSAISAGMLIYAATVEMIAADFVFGDVEGNHHHHHHHADTPSDEDSGFPREEHEGDHHDHHMGAERTHPEAGGNNGRSRTSTSLDTNETRKSKQPTAIRKQVLAVLSLFAGAGAMVLVGLGE